MPTRHERSAGVLVYRGKRNDPHFLLLDYGRHWDYPKGHVEEGEDDRTAALRELEEETGITEIELADGFLHEMAYFFRHKKRGMVRKTVVFFLGHTDEKKIELSDEHVAAEFLPYKEALKRVTYPKAKDALKKAKAFLDA
jgi:bis(5'-nucleosidyl)-tetraphosphatase